MVDILEHLKFFHGGSANAASLEESIHSDITDMVNNVFSSTQSSGYRSVMINFARGSSLSSSDGFRSSLESLSKALGYYIQRILKHLITTSRDISYALKVVERYLDMHKELFGRDTTQEMVRDGTIVGDLASSALTSDMSGDINLMGCFEGFIKEHLEEDFSTFRLADNFVDTSLNIFINPDYATYNSITDKEPYLYALDDVALTMFDLPNDVDIDELSDEDIASYSVIDYMKYADEDLLLDPSNMSDIGKEDGKDRFLSSVVSTFNKKMTEMYEDPTIIGDAVVKNIIPDKVDSGIDILNVGKDQRAENYGDIEISRISFNRSNLIKSARLIAKVLQRFNKIEKENAKAATNA
jgi:hypothetical protein